MRHGNMILVILVMLSGVLTSCIDKDRIVDKRKIAPGDYRQFQGTPVWSLAKAAWDEDIDRMREIIDKNPELMELRDSLYGNTLLMVTITKQQYRPFKMLLDNGANLHYYNKLNGFSPIIEACSYEDNDVTFVTELIRYGANVNDRRELDFAENGERGSSPLIYAATCGNIPVAKELISKGAYINAVDEYNHDTALGAAISTDSYEMAYYLLTQGADYEIPMFYARDRKGKMTIPAYIGKVLRLSTPSPFTRDFREKRKVIEYLRQRGYDYDTVPIPENVVKRVRKLYPFFWKLYLKYY